MDSDDDMNDDEYQRRLQEMDYPKGRFIQLDSPVKRSRSDRDKECPSWGIQSSRGPSPSSRDNSPERVVRHRPESSRADNRSSMDNVPQGSDKISQSEINQAMAQASRDLAANIQEQRKKQELEYAYEAILKGNAIRNKYSKRKCVFFITSRDFRRAMMWQEDEIAKNPSRRPIPYQQKQNTYLDPDIRKACNVSSRGLTRSVLRS